MQRIRTLLIKLTDLAQRNSDRTLIDVDLMLDYTRVLYADLLEIRGSMAGRQPTAADEPTLDELSAAIIPEQIIAVAVKAPFFNQEKEPVAAPLPQPSKPVQPAPAALPNWDIRQFIDLNDKYLFLSEFFGNDVRAYEEMMNHLNTLRSEKDALNFLGHKLDDNEGALAFKSVLGRFYSVS